MKIAVIAHDGKKAEMVAFLRSHLDILTDKKIQLVATGTTGKHAMNAGLKVERMLSGPDGGDAQIAAMVANNGIRSFDREVGVDAICLLWGSRQRSMPRRR